MTKTSKMPKSAQPLNQRPEPKTEKRAESDSEQSLERIIEAVLSVAEAPVSKTRLRNLFPETARPDNAAVETAIAKLQQAYANHALELVKHSDGYRFQTRAAYSQWINTFFETRPPKLSRALLETLSIIAYRQPVTRGDIQEVRGVAVSSDIIARLLERQWIKKVGERSVPGKPGLYGTTTEFLAYFNIASLKELPELLQARDLEEVARDFGQMIQQQTEIPSPTVSTPDAALTQTDESKS